MAVNLHPFNCDKCNRPKDPTNNWLVGFIGDKTFSLETWDDERALLEGAAHLCGAECAQRWTNEQLARLLAPPTKKEERPSDGAIESVPTPRNSGQ